MDGWLMDGWTGVVDRWMDGFVDEWMDVLVDGCAD